MKIPFITYRTNSIFNNHYSQKNLYYFKKI